MNNFEQFWCTEWKVTASSTCFIFYSEAPGIYQKINSAMLITINSFYSLVYISKETSRTLLKHHQHSERIQLGNSPYFPAEFNYESPKFYWSTLKFQ